MAHRLSPEAEGDLDDLWYFVASHSSIETADRLIDVITTRLFLLGTHPRAGRGRDDIRVGLRSFPVGEYVILYRLDGSNVLILRVVHGSRDLKGLL
jgi:toxin ParE1/3/4